MVASVAPLGVGEAPKSPPRCFGMISFNRKIYEDNLAETKKLGSKALYYFLHVMHHDMEDTSHFGELSPEDYKDDEGGIAMNPQARFFFEPSKKEEGYMHIKCGYNNKYWVARETEDLATGRKADYLVIATTPERQEDKTSELCTLFKVDLSLNYTDGAGNNVYNVNLLDARQNKTALISYTNKEKQQVHDTFLARDLSDIVVLPRHVVFKGDNGKYASARQVNGGSYCQFSSNDITDPSVMFTTFHNDDGTVRIKSNAYDRFLRLSPAWIWPDGGDNPNDKDMLFKVTQIDDYYLLKNLGNQRFCERYSADRKTDVLNAAVDHVTKEAKLWVEEAVLSREIYNVIYHGLDKARVYDSKTLNMASSCAINATSQNNNVKLSLTTTQTQSSTWDSSVSAKIGCKSSINASVPSVGGASEEWSAEVESGFSFGETEVTETKQEIVYEVVVPAKKKVTVSAIATQAKCDVPYSYTQRDMMPNGEVLITTHHDGLYRGKSTFNLQYVTTEEDVPAEFFADAKK